VWCLGGCNAALPGDVAATDSSPLAVMRWSSKAVNYHCSVAIGESAVTDVVATGNDGVMYESHQRQSADWCSSLSLTVSVTTLSRHYF